MRLAAAVVLAVLPLAVPTLAGCHRQPSAVVGTATYGERGVLPKDATFVAALIDVPPSGAPMRVVAMTMTRAPGQPPVSFRIPVQGRLLDATHRYLIRAQLTSGGRVLFGVDRPYAVPSRGNGPAVELTLARINGT